MRQNSFVATPNLNCLALQRELSVIHIFMKNPIVPVCIERNPRGFASRILVLYAHFEISNELISVNGLHALADYFCFVST